MGKIEKVSCHSCGKSWEYRIGCGIQHGKLESIVGLYDKQTAIRIRAYIGKIPPVLFDFSYYPARCVQCRSLLSVPVLCMKEGGETFAGLCPACGQEAEKIQEIKNTCCPACGADDLISEKTGNWD